MVDRLVRVITFVALLAGWPDSGASAHGCDIIVDPNPLRASTVSSAHNVTPILLSSISREKVGADIHVCFSAGRHHLGASRGESSARIFHQMSIGEQKITN